MRKTKARTKQSFTACIHGTPAPSKDCQQCKEVIAKKLAEAEKSRRCPTCGAVADNSQNRREGHLGLHYLDAVTVPPPIELDKERGERVTTLISGDCWFL